MSNLRKHAEVELKASGYKLDGTDEPYNKLAADSILELIDVFSSQGHSGFSANYCLHAFGKLAAFEPLGPLTGADDVWAEVDVGMFQNKRCSHVFKDGDGQAYDLNAVVFEEPSGDRFTGRHSRQFVTFPYAPRSVIAHVKDDATDLDKQLAAEAAWGAK